jgi:hypothetical protein
LRKWQGEKAARLYQRLSVLFHKTQNLRKWQPKKGLKIGRRKEVIVSQLENTDIEAVIETNKS